MMASIYTAERSHCCKHSFTDHLG